jgi:hypothetical protein
MSKNRIVRPVVTPTLVIGTSTTVATASAVALNGFLAGVLITPPAAVDSSATITLKVVDADGFTVYTKASIAANTPIADFPTTQVPLSGTFTITATYSAAQTVNRAVAVALLIDGGL